jgi:hypothetical protein
MTQEFLERTDTAGNIIYTSKTGERLNMEPVQEKNKDVVATMTFPAEQLMQMINGSSLLSDIVVEAIENYDLSNLAESVSEEIDWTDKVTDVLDNIDLEDYVKTANIANEVLESLDYTDIAREVKDYLDPVDANELANELLSSFNYNETCQTGKLFISAVEDIIAGYIVKTSKVIDQLDDNKNRIVDGVEVINRSFTIKEIVETLNSLNYTEYNKNMLITSLALIK